MTFPAPAFLAASIGHAPDLGGVETPVRSHGLVFYAAAVTDQRSTAGKACDVVCLPSRNEPFGITAVEGWAAHKPVVASENGGPSEFIWHNVNGLKVYPNANSNGWGLGTLFTNFEWARWMGTNGHRAVESAFTWDIIAQKTEQCYDFT